MGWWPSSLSPEEEYFSSEENDHKLAEPFGRQLPEPSAPPLPVAEYPFDATKYQLDNGLTYYIKQNKNPEGIVELNLFVKAGSICENDKEHGVAHLIEHLAFRGCEYSAHQNSTSYHDGTCYSFSVKHMSDVANVIALMAQIAQELVVTPDILENEKGVVIDELWLFSQDEDRVRRQALDSLIYQGTKYAKPSSGTRKSVQEISLAVVEEFYRKWYIPSNMVVIVVGDLTETQPQDVITWIGYHFGRKGYTIPPVLEFPFPRCTHPRLFAHVDSAVTKLGQSEVYFTYMVENTKFECLKDAVMYYQRLLLLEVLLNRLKRKFSRVWKQIPCQTQMCTTYTIWVECEGTEAITILETFFCEISQMRVHGIEEDELTLARKLHLDIFDHSYLDRNRTSDHLRGLYITNFMYNDVSKALRLRVLRTMILSVQIKDMRSFCQMFFRESNISVIIIQSKALVMEEDMRTSLQKINDIKGKGCNHCWSSDEEEMSATETGGREIELEEIVERIEYPGIGVTELRLFNGMRVSYKSTKFEDEVFLSGFAYGGLAEVPEKDFHSCEMLSLIADKIFFKSSKKLRLLCERVHFCVHVDEYKRWFEARFSLSDIKSVLQIVYFLFTSDLEPEEKKLQAEIDKIIRRLSRGRQGRDYILRATEMEINSGGSHLYKRRKAEDLSDVDATKAWQFFRSCFQDPSNFQVILIGNFDPATACSLLSRYLGRIPRSFVSLMEFQRENLKTAPFNFPQTVTMKEVTMSKHSGEGMICSISFPLHLKNIETLEEYMFLVCILREVMKVKVEKVLHFHHREVCNVKAGHFFPFGTKSGDISFSFHLKDSDIAQMVIDTVVFEIDQLVEEGPTEDLVKHVLDGVPWNFAPDSNSASMDQLLHLYWSNMYDGNLDHTCKIVLGVIKRVSNSFSAKGAKFALRRILSYPCREQYTVVKLRY